MSETNEAPASRAATDRIVALDVLRGVAVLGILLINIGGMGGILEAFDYPGNDTGPALGWSLLNRTLWFVSQIFVEGTMRGLFTLLFGAGFILFCAREATSAGRTDIGVLYLRRSALLVLFGALHALVLFWPGDILFIYGIAAFFLFPFRSASVRTLLLVGGGLLIALAVVSYTNAFLGRPEALAEVASGATLPGTTVLDRIDHEVWAREIATRRGDYATNAAYFYDVFVRWTLDLGIFWWVGDALGLMLIGAALYRMRIITGERDAAFYVTLAAIGYGIGLPLNILETAAHVGADFSPAVIWPAATYEIGRLATTLGHLGFIIAVFKSGAFAGLFRALQRVGQMALTNYLGQSAICAFLFSGFGFGLYGAVDRAGLWSIAICIWAVQILFSTWWLSRYRMGPVEWLWRTGTYGAPPKLRR